MSVDPNAGIWALNTEIKEMYTTVHVDNVTSRTAFVKGGYSEVCPPSHREPSGERPFTLEPLPPPYSTSLPHHPPPHHPNTRS